MAQELLKDIDPEVLPKDYGGKATIPSKFD